MCATRGRDLPPEDVRWIERLFRYGFTWRKIRRTTGFSTSTIRRYMPQRNKADRDDERAERAQLAEQIRTLRSSGMTGPKIAERLGLGKRRVKNVLDVLRRQKADERAKLANQSASPLPKNQ